MAARTLNACQLTNSVWDYPLKPAQCKLALARKDPTSSLAILDDVIDTTRRSGFRQYLPEALYLKGEAHRMRGEMEPARNAFEDARIVAEGIGSRLSLWWILGAMAEVTPDKQSSEALRALARDDLRVPFMQSEGVRALMS